ncbi:hypothetical protein J3R30DRAFT_3656073 [Lentinula aciculospora]|uniref:Uncharacterized protein n=1 Tax=Lentinula aciculospora TaxID=153920 RepID=A0A9W9AKW4_9AGAR|nr:hypothetical protein J3R30DRAFT_3656073 [Lentinula aciculospora]
MCSSNDTRLWNSTIGVLLLLASMATTTSALPLRLRRDTASGSTSVDTVANYMQTALQTYLAGQNAVSNFHAISDGWKPINFAGTSTSLNADEAANSVFYLTDQIQGGSTTVSYSGMMISFIQDMNVAMNLKGSTNGANSPDVTKAQKESTQACYQAVPAALNQVVKEYTEQQGVAPKNRTDPQFLQFAAKNSEYIQASTICQSTTNAYQAALSKAVGDDFYIFSGALNNIEQITTATTLIDGLNMEVSSETTSIGQGDGKYKPYYSIPTLNGTMSAWQSNGDGFASSPAFTWSSSSSSGSVTNTSSSGGDFSASGAGSSSSSKSTSNVTSVGMTVSFGQISMFAVESGLWDAPEVAEALQNPPDAVAQKGAPVFQKYYGSASKPGPLASWKDQALVVYQPSFSVEFSSAADASEFHQTSASAGVCIFIICVGGSGSSSSSTVNYSTGSKFVTYNDTTNQAYLVGFTQTNFFTNQGTQDGSDWPSLLGNSTSGTDSNSTSSGNSTTDTNSTGDSSSDSSSETDTDSTSAGDSTSDTDSTSTTDSSSTGDTASSTDASSLDTSSASSKNNGTSTDSSSEGSSSSGTSSDGSSPTDTSSTRNGTSSADSSSSTPDGTSSTDSASTTPGSDSSSDSPSSSGNTGSTGNKGDSTSTSSDSTSTSNSTSANPKSSWGNNNAQSKTSKSTSDATTPTKMQRRRRR